MLQEFPAGPFSLNPNLLRDVLCYAKPMGHNEQPENLNLGFGFIYYGLVRALRPGHVLVIGSGFGFSVVCLALGLKDNGKGRLTFVDPSYSVFKNGPFQTLGGRGQWDSPQAVRAHFERFGVEHLVTHHRLRSDEFFPLYPRLGLPPVDVAFIDGNHSYASVEYDFRQVLQHTRKNSYVLLHDTNIYIREVMHHAGVKRWLKLLRRDKECFEVLDFPFSSGVGIVRILQDGPWTHPR
jgi:predicted O-methyltransferase YrrM